MQKFSKIATQYIVILIIFLSLLVTTASQNTVSAESISPEHKPTFTTDVFSSDKVTGQTSNAASNKKFDPKDTDKAIQYMKMIDERALPPMPLLNQSSSSAAKPPTPTTTPSNSNYIQPILFIPSDFSESPGNATAITETFQLLKRWYSGALEVQDSSYSYRVADTIVYHASHPFSYYKCLNHEPSCDNYEGIWENVQTELLSAGYPLWTNGTSHAIFVKGAGGWAGANCDPGCLTNYPSPGPASHAGVAIWGDWALDAITGTINSDCFASIGTACYLDPQRGTIGHELGHTFGLAHALDQTGSIMYSWWDFPFVSLFSTVGNDEKGLLRSSSIFFSPQACSKDVLINQTTMPMSVQARSQFLTSFTVTNYGFCQWATSKVNLHIVRDDVWRVREQSLAQNVYPAQPYTFSLQLTAPNSKTTSAIYNNYWQLRDVRTYFGSQMGHQVTVLK